MAQSQSTQKIPRRQSIALSEATWRRHISQWKDSNLSQVTYCQQNDLRIGSFGTWKGRIDQVDNKASKHFVPVRSKPTQDTIILEISFPGNVSLKIPSSTDPAIILPWITALRDQA